jgi:dienelactone hydrolase
MPTWIKLLSTFILICLAFSACGGSASNTNSNTITNAVEKLVEPVPAPQTVSITSPDDVVLVGTFLAANKPNSPALLLLHQWESNRHSYDDFAKEMQVAGFNVLAIDGRGFGESTKKTDGTAIAAGRTDADVKAMLGDIGTASDFLAKQINVDPKRIGIVGASYGSSLALIYAADNPKVAAVALLSPGLNYFGNMPTEPAIVRLNDCPVFQTAAEDDPDSFNSVTRLSELTNESNRAVTVTVKEGGHGTALLKVNAVREPLGTFLKERLGVEPQK